MPARDHDHDRVRHALLADGWTITHDPLRLRWGGRDMYVDLGAERMIAAAIGQYALYRDVMDEEVIRRWTPVP